MNMEKFKQLNNKDEWILAEDIPDIDFFFAQIWLSSFVNDLKNSCGKNYKKVLSVSKRLNLKFYYGEKDSLDFEKHLIGLIEKDTNFGHLINKNIIKWSDKLKKFSDTLAELDFKKLDNKELLLLIRKQDNIHTKLYEWGWLSNATDMFHSSFTNRLKSYLQQRLKDGSHEELNKIFFILTAPDKKSVAIIEEENLLKIVLKIKNNKDKINSKIGELINEHYKKYFYLKYQWLGSHGVYTEKYFVRQIQNILNDKVIPEEKLKEHSYNLIKQRKLKEKIFLELKINVRTKELFKIYSDFMLTKIYRRYVQIYWAYQMRSLLEEIGQRLKLSLNEIRFLLPQEIAAGLLNNKIDRIEIKKRTKFCFYYAEKDNEIMSADKNSSVLKQLNCRVDKNIKELHGQAACLGKVTGVVKIINSPRDMKKMNKGDILVSIATNPDIVPAMKKAAAIVTEQGGVTCHAAIVSRELNTPCIIGTKIATKILHDGQIVEVDANKGVIKIIK